MVEVLKGEYWSKSEAFLLPLTGLSKSQKYQLKTYLFWGDHSIEDYKLILKFDWDNYDEFLQYCRRVVIPVLDRRGYLMETYDFKNETIMVLDISEWAFDIGFFLQGRYSKMSRDAKDTISEFHTFYDNGAKIYIEISASLEPFEKFPILGNKVAIEYVADNYGLNLEALRKTGELGGIYDKEKETLIYKNEEIAG